MGVKTAEAMREYRARIARGEHVVTPKVRELPPEVVLTADETAELESVWQVEYRKVIAAWLIRQRSDHTRRAYQRAWRMWIDWCNEHGQNPIEPGPGTGAVFLSDIGHRYKPASVAQYRTAIRAALVELSVEGLRVGGDPFSRVRGMPVPNVTTEIPISDEDVERMISTAASLGGQHLTAVLLCAVMGLRASEAAQVNRHSVANSPWGKVASIVGKGHKRALVPIPDVVLEAAAIDGWPTDEAMCKGYERIRYLVRATGWKAGLDISPHQFRHWHCTAALEAGVPLERVQDSMRHVDPATTQRYNHARHKVQNHTAYVIANLPAITGVHDE